MKQKKLFEPQTFKCEYCGKTFKTENALKAHISRYHADEVDVYPGEGITATVRKGNYVYITLAIRSSLWHDLNLISKRTDTPLKELLFKALVEATNPDFISSPTKISEQLRKDYHLV
jgi:hypothetical protein